MVYKENKYFLFGCEIYFPYSLSLGIWSSSTTPSLPGYPAG
jgi:hypothetical protein